MPPGRASLSLFAAASLALACRRNDPVEKLSREEIRRTLAQVERRLAEQEARKRRKPPPRSARSSGSADAEQVAVEEERPAAEPARSTQLAPSDAPWIADTAVDIGRPGPATATAMGVVLNTREGELAIARLGKLPRGGAAAPSPVQPLPSVAGSFGLGRGPSLFQSCVYWISHGSLVRRCLPPHGPPGPLEILSRDAFDGTRVGVPIAAPGRKLAAIPATVAYVVRPAKEDGPLLAKLWVEGSTPQVLTAEGNSTHSVSLVHTEDGVLAVSVQARMAMTPVHARRIRLASGRPLLGEDIVVWVGGGIQPLTEMTILPTGEHDLIGLIPHERSMKEFGIARLDIGMSPGMDTPTTWTLYPNGIDPAPVAAAHLCGEPVMLYAAPETAAPDSHQELLLRALDDPSGKRFLRIASSRAFYFASIAEVPGGALSVWVTDEGTRASTVRCTSRPK